MAINKINRVVIHDDLLEELDGMATKQELQNTKTNLENSMNEVYQGIAWKPVVSTFDDLRTAYPDAKDGWKATVEDTNITYQYDLETDKWFPTSINALPLATSEIDGLMGQADKGKLNTIEENAQKNLSANQTLEQIKTVDGKDSGLDADLFQGKKPDEFAEKEHDHNGVYYTKTESNTLLNGKAPKSHVHSKESIIDFEHGHDASDIVGLPTKVGDLENDKGYITSDDLGNAGLGDMTKAVYDTNNDGVIDRADVANSVDWGSVQDKPTHLSQFTNDIKPYHRGSSPPENTNLLWIKTIEK